MSRTKRVRSTRSKVAVTDDFDYKIKTPRAEPYVYRWRASIEVPEGYDHLIWSGPSTWFETDAPGEWFVPCAHGMHPGDKRKIYAFHFREDRDKFVRVFYDYDAKKEFVQAAGLDLVRPNAHSSAVPRRRSRRSRR